MNYSITLDARKLTVSLVRAFLVLLACQLMIAVAHLVLHVRASAFTVLFDMDLEANLPVFFNSGLFFLLALLCYLGGRSDDPGMRKGWMLLAVVLLFLGVDEGSQIHERFMLWSMRLISNGQPGRDLGLFHYAWVIPYMIAAAVLVMVLARFLLRLPSRTRNGLIIAGSIYVLGAVVMEMISGTIAKPLEGEPTTMAMAYLPCEIYPVGECNLYLSSGYVIAYTIEESLEMCGLIACIHVVMRHLQRGGQRITLEIPKVAS